MPAFISSWFNFKLKVSRNTDISLDFLVSWNMSVRYKLMTFSISLITIIMALCSSLNFINLGSLCPPDLSKGLTMLLIFTKDLKLHSLAVIKY